MNHFSLTNDEQHKLEMRHKQSRDQRECDRIKAVLLSHKGWSSDMIAQALLIKKVSVERHINDYLSSDKLTLESGGSTGYLTQQQTDELTAHLAANSYAHNHEIVAYIQTQYSITFTVAGLHKWLHRHGFSYKQYKGIPHKVDLAQQAHFVEHYTTLKKQLPEGEQIYFMDAVHPTQATKLSHGWIKTGTDKTIKTTGSRTRLNILGTIRLNHLKDSLIQRYDTIDSKTIVTYLNDLRRHCGTLLPIHLILDGAGYHRAKIVAQEAGKLDITLHFLPPYSPNLNPIERLWKVMNEKVRNNQFFSSAADFRQKIDAFFETTLPAIGDTLNSRINDNFERFESLV